MVAGGAQLRAAREESFGERIGAFEGLRQEGRGGGPDFGIQGIEEDQVEVAKERGEEGAKCLAQSAAGLVGGGDLVEDVGGEREAVEERPQLPRWGPIRVRENRQAGRRGHACAR